MKSIIAVAAGLALVAGPALAATHHVDTGLGTPTACGAQWKHLRATNATGGMTRLQFMRQCVVKYTTANETTAPGGAAAGGVDSSLIWAGAGLAAVGGIVAAVVATSDDGKRASP